MIRHMIVRNVLHRPVRTLISVVAVGVEVTLVLIVVGLTSGLLAESAKRIEGVGADIMVQPPSASVFMAFSGAPMPIRIRDKLEEMKYVQAVAPVLLQFNSSGGLDIIYGIEPESFRAVSGGFVFHSGKIWRIPTTFWWTTGMQRPSTYTRDRCCIFLNTIFMWRASLSTARERGCSS